MFSTIVEFFEKLQERKLKKAKKELKKQEGKENVVDKVSDKAEKIIAKKYKSAAFVKKMEDKLLKSKVSPEEVKKQRVKLWALRILKWILQVIETIISYLVALLGTTGILIILIVFVLMLVIYGLLQIDWTISDGELYKGPGYDSYEDCIQGANALYNNNFDLSNTSQLMGTLTKQQQNILKCVGIYNEILSGKYGDLESIFAVDGFGNLINQVSRQEAISLLMGMMSIECGFTFPGSDDILTIPCNTKKDTNNDAFLGLEADQGTFIGKYEYSLTGRAGTKLYNEDFVQKYTAVYKYNSLTDTKYSNPSKSLNNYVPYGIATQIGVVSLKYNGLSDFRKFLDENLVSIAGEFGITHNIDVLRGYIEFFMTFNGYHGRSSSMDEPCVRYWCALWACTSDIDAERGYHLINYNPDADNAVYRALGYHYAASWYNGEILGYSSYKGTYGDDTVTITNCNYVEGKKDIKGRIQINGYALEIPLIQYVKEYCESNGYGASFQCVIDDLNSRKNASTLGRAVLNHNYSYGFVAYLTSKIVMDEIGISVPIASGGSVEDCECYEYGLGEGSSNSNHTIETSFDTNIIKGEIQGDWPADIKALMETDGRYNKYYGRLASIEEPDKPITTGSSMTREQWRLASKWKVPYQYQSYILESCWYPSTGLNFGSTTMGSVGGSETGDCCPYVMNAYIFSAMTGKAINTPEFTSAVLWYAYKGYGGDGYATAKMAEDMGFYIRTMSVKHNSDGSPIINNYNMVYCSSEEDAPILYPESSLSLQEQVNSVLSNGGIVGITINGRKGSKLFSGQHYMVVTEKVTDNTYNIHLGVKGGYAEQTITFEELFGVNGAYLSDGDPVNLIFAYNPNIVEYSGPTGSGGSTQSKTTEFKNFLFIGDSYTVGLKMIAEGQGHQVRASIGATCSEWVDTTTSTKEIGMNDVSVTLSDIDEEDINGVVVLLGANSPTQLGSMKSFLSELKGKYSNIPIYVQKVFPMGANYTYMDVTTYNNNITTYNAGLESFCKANGFNFIDTTTNLVTSDGFLLNPDVEGIHLTGNDYNVWWGNIEKAIANGQAANTPTNYMPTHCIDVGGEGVFVETPGQFQGPWGDLTSYINQLNDLAYLYSGTPTASNPPTATTLGKKIIGLVEHVGKAPDSEGRSNYEYEVDKWKEKNGMGVVRYAQTTKNCAGEDWASLSYGDATFYQAACGCYSASCIISTMTGKYVNPVEVSLAASTYSLRHPEDNGWYKNHINEVWDASLYNSATGKYGDFKEDSGAYQYTILGRVIAECGLKVEYGNSLDKSKLDSCLSSGGMVLWCVNNKLNNRFTTGGHYVVIREKVGNDYLIYSSTNWSSILKDNYANTPNTWSELQTLDNGQIVYVTP